MKLSETKWSFFHHSNLPPSLPPGRPHVTTCDECIRSDILFIQRPGSPFQSQLQFIRVLSQGKTRFSIFPFILKVPPVPNSLLFSEIFGCRCRIWRLHLHYEGRMLVIPYIRVLIWHFRSPVTYVSRKWVVKPVSGIPLKRWLGRPLRRIGMVISFNRLSYWCYCYWNRRKRGSFARDWLGLLVYILGVGSIFSQEPRNNRIESSSDRCDRWNCWANKLFSVGFVRILNCSLSDGIKPGWLTESPASLNHGHSLHFPLLGAI